MLHKGATFVMNGGYIQNNDFSDTMNSGMVYVRPYYGNSSFCDEQWYNYKQ